MNLKYTVVLVQEFTEVPSRSEKATVVVARMESDHDCFIIQYNHHEGISTYTSIVDFLNHFSYLNYNEYPGIPKMIDAIRRIR